MQGLYRVRIGDAEALESFVAAPGPMGWRYFGRGNEASSGAEIYQVDHVVDASWNLVRFRWRTPEGLEVVASPGAGGVDVWIDEPGGGRQSLVAGAVAAWSPSPASLLILDRLVASSPNGEATAVMLEPPFDPHAVRVRVMAMGSPNVAGIAGSSKARDIALTVGSRATRALIRPDLPLHADGWFDLVG